MTLDPIEAAEVDAPAPPVPAAASGLAGPPASLKLLRGDIEASDWRKCDPLPDIIRYPDADIFELLYSI